MTRYSTLQIYKPGFLTAITGRVSLARSHGFSIYVSLVSPMVLPIAVERDGKLADQRHFRPFQLHWATLTD